MNYKDLGKDGRLGQEADRVTDAPHSAASASSPSGSAPTGAAERKALEDCVGALQFILAFYEPGQRYLDTEAWKQACGSGVRAYINAATLIGWAFRPMKAVNGEVHYEKAPARHSRARGES